MNYTQPKEVIIAALPKLQFQLDSDIDYDEQAKKLLATYDGFDVLIDTAFIEAFIKATCVGYVAETIENAINVSAELQVAMLIVSPMEMFDNAMSTIMPFGKATYVAKIHDLDSVPVFKLMWEERNNTDHMVEQKLIEIIARKIVAVGASCSAYIKQLSDESAKKELLFLDNPSKYVKYLPELVGKFKWSITKYSVTKLTPEALETISDNELSDELLDMMTDLYYGFYNVAPQLTPLVYRQFKDYLMRFFTNHHSVKIENTTCIRNGARNKFCALLYLNRGEILETDWYTEKFGHISIDLYMRDKIKLSHNGSFGAFGHRKTRSNIVKPNGRKTVHYEMRATVSEKPDMPNGLYLSTLNRTHGGLIKQLTPEEPVETDVFNYHEVDSQYLFIKPVSTDTLNFIKEQRMLYHIAMNKPCNQVIIVSELFDATELLDHENVKQISIDPHLNEVHIVDNLYEGRVNVRRRVRSNRQDFNGVAFLVVESQSL